MRTFLFLGELNDWEARRDIGEEGEKYKYPLAPNGHLSHGSASLQVRQCRTTQDSKGKIEV